MGNLQMLINRHERKQGKGAISDYIRIKRERYNFTFTFHGETGIRYYTVHGTKVSEGEFNRLFPTGSIQHKRINIDSTHIS